MSDKKSHIIFVEDILKAMDKVECYIKDSTYETFVKNDMLIDAVIRNIETHQYNTK